MNTAHAPRTRTRRTLAVTGAALAASLALVAPASAASADLIDATPAEVALDAPAPGESQTWTMSVTSTTDQTVSLDLAVTGASDLLFGGEHPLEITITDDAGAVVLDQTQVADVLDTTLDLPDLPAGASRQFVGTVTLPQAAGNEYQGAGGELTLRFVAQADERAPAAAPTTAHSTPGRQPLVQNILSHLPRTGPGLLAATVTLGAVSIALGLALRRRSKKTESHV